MKIQEILEVKATIVELVKDSPLVMYMAFYEPLHGWLNGIAQGWDPLAKFLLNIVMVIYGVLRIIAIVKGWGSEKDDSPSDEQHIP
jgi:hypothetical protein